MLYDRAVCSPCCKINFVLPAEGQKCEQMQLPAGRFEAKAGSLLKKRTRCKRPLKNEVLFFFIPVIFASTMTVGMLAYYLETKQVEKNALNLTEDTVKQTAILINDKLLSAFSQVDIISRNTMTQNLLMDNYPSRESAQRYNDIISLKSLLDNSYQNSYPMIDSIYFCNRTGFQLGIYNDAVYKKIDFTSQKWQEEYKEKNSGYYWLNTHADDIFVTENKRQVISVFRNISYAGQGVNGILLFSLKSRYFSDILNDVQIGRHGYALVVSKDGVIKPGHLSAPAYALSENEIRQLRGRLGRTGSMTVKNQYGQNLMVVYGSMDVNQWLVAAVVPEADLQDNAFSFRFVLVVIMLLALLLSSLLSILFTNRITTPVVYLSEQVDKFEKGELNVSFNVRVKNEVGVLARGLSNLSKSVNELLLKVQFEQEQKNKLELKALQSQIQPHFLYNTLASLKNLIQLNEMHGAEKMCEALIQFYRISLSKGAETISIKSEMDQVRSYLLIQKMRYGKRFDFDIHLDRKILNAGILKLTVQPIVENSIRHGFNGKEEPGLIVITAQRDGNDCLLEVYDDGVGIAEEKLKTLTQSINNPKVWKQGKAFGLWNVNQRLKLNYGDGYGITLASVQHVYTKVQVRIPFQRMGSV